jgi:hypothetical protein
MKKILLLLPIIGICSSLFAQAPKVENVVALQKEGTKFVIISADMSGKDSEPLMYFEVWFKQTAAETSWQRVPNLKELYNVDSDPNDPAGATELPANEAFDSTTGTYVKASFHLNGVGSVLTSKIFAWDAGAETAEFKSDDAVIKIISFYPKKDEYGSPKVNEQQVSGWDGIGEFSVGGDSGTPGGF